MNTSKAETRLFIVFSFIVYWEQYHVSLFLLPDSIHSPQPGGFNAAHSVVEQILTYYRKESQMEWLGAKIIIKK